MEIIKHEKLVRDRIPEIIRREGKSPVTDKLRGSDILPALDQKLSEEVSEFQRSHELEEIADILEVLHGIAFHRGISWNDIESERLQKREARGGFEQGICLKEVWSE